MVTDARGVVYLVGAGPGDPELITVRGLRLLREADVVVHDRLIGRELLDEVRSGAEVIDAGKSRGTHRMSQDQINALLVDRGLKGHNVARLKGGDPFVFGRGFEELTACREAGIPCVVVPGVSSAIAGPAAAGIPVTLRDVARSAAIVSPAAADGAIAPLNYTALAAIDTLVILMGRASLATIAESLIRAGRDRTTPAAVIQSATTTKQQVACGDLATIAEVVDAARMSPPVVTVVGAVAAEAEAATCLARLASQSA
jgi:uroporphyrin-III C-methyltransferase